MPRRISRRRFAQFGVVALAGFAGCGSPGDDGEGDGEDEEDGAEDDGNGEEEEDALQPRNREPPVRRSP